MPQGRRPDVGESGRTGRSRAYARTVGAAGEALESLEQVAGALVTAVLALVVLLWLAICAVLSIVGVGLLLLPRALAGVHVAADRERLRLRRAGSELPDLPPPPPGLRDALADPGTRRELRWLLGHATGGLLLAGLGLLLPVSALRDITLPLWWRAFPDGSVTPTLSFWTVHDGWGALAALLLGLGWLALSVGLTPVMARWMVRRGLRLLSADPTADLTLRVAQLSATRAAALDAHATELRRIERALHDGTQNRLVAVTVLLGAARRAAQRDPVAADGILEKAQAAAEDALAELRVVARSILPPVLADRGLEGALHGLATTSAVPCTVTVDVEGRCAAAVEATAYFVVAEALTNASRHSGASHVDVELRRTGDLLRLRVIDDGAGGADEDAGTGIAGMRRRIAALDGTLSLTSPVGGPTTLEVELPCGS
ncbi:signal transduction histidine kinase [Motilibacter rhizosphaerae]|uniref:histidine kinase n=1 Tax=Motilibacter rhizosphaerae TaxID=598652 RepID=A0A4Q7NWD3_9ACTN|nr:sensor domain-containing protein [Motilibacter rhizosphaerae]RZS91616.1 signal transduction histidine kinase [Motilibacter rhizosphaerae]